MTVKTLCRLENSKELLSSVTRSVEFDARMSEDGQPGGSFPVPWSRHNPHFLSSGLPPHHLLTPKVALEKGLLSRGA